MTGTAATRSILSDPNIRIMAATSVSLARP
jgi:hypothetical protein